MPEYNKTLGEISFQGSFIGARTGDVVDALLNQMQEQHPQYFQTPGVNVNLGNLAPSYDRGDYTPSTKAINIYNVEDRQRSDLDGLVDTLMHEMQHARSGNRADNNPELTKNYPPRNRFALKNNRIYAGTDSPNWKKFIKRAAQLGLPSISEDYVSSEEIQASIVPAMDQIMAGKKGGENTQIVQKLRKEFPEIVDRIYFGNRNPEIQTPMHYSGRDKQNETIVDKILQAIMGDGDFGVPLSPEDVSKTYKQIEPRR